MNKKEIEQIHKKFRVPKHVVKHMETVAKVAEQLSQKFENKNIRLDKEKLITAALLHDTLRICDFRDFDPRKMPQEVNKEDVEVWQKLRIKYGEIGHARAMSDYLYEINESELANLVLKHDFKQIDNLHTWEEKLIYYSDKRVDHDRIVDLDTRFTEGAKRNRKSTEKSSERDEIVAKVYLLEKEIEVLVGSVKDLS